MAKVLSKSRKQNKKMGGVVLRHGNAADMGGFKHIRIGHEIAKPTYTVDGKQVYQTPTGKKYIIKKM